MVTIMSRDLEVSETRQVEPERQTTLSELARMFGRLGCTAFGGPAAHIAMMEDEVVRRRRWMTSEQFLDLIGATNLIPGPNSTEMAIHIGFARARWAGLFVAGLCFILPAVAIVTAIAWAYVRFGSLPQVTGIFYGIKPVIIAIVVQALWSLGKTAVKTRLLAAVAIASTIASLAGINELLILVGAGALVALIRSATSRGSRVARSWLPLPMLGGASVVTAAPVAFGLWPLLLFFLKVGSVLFGSGYVLLAFLRGDLVERLHWISSSQLLDAVAVGQVTPGPVFTTATFIGYLLAGGRGAALATVGIFAPAFVFVAISGPLVRSIRSSSPARAVLDGVNAASMALMAAVSWQLGRSAIIDIPAAIIALMSAVALFKFRVNSLWLVLGGAIVGSAVTYGPALLGR